MKEQSENRRALPKFFLTMLGSLLVGGAAGLAIGMGHIFGVDLSDAAAWLDGTVYSATSWAIPVTSVLTLGGAFWLYRRARQKVSGWDGGDENDASEEAERLLSWSMLLSAVQLLINLFFMAAVAVYYMEKNGLPIVAEFIVSCGLVIFAQQKAVDLTRKMNPEKRGSVYDSKFQKKWLESCDESEQRQIGQACYRAYMVTTRVCIGVWMALVLLSMVYRISLLSVFVLLLVWGTMQTVYTLECIRLSRKSGE